MTAKSIPKHLTNIYLFDTLTSMLSLNLRCHALWRLEVRKLCWRRCQRLVPPALRRWGAVIKETLNALSIELLIGTSCLYPYVWHMLMLGSTGSQSWWWVIGLAGFYIWTCGIACVAWAPQIPKDAVRFGPPSGKGFGRFNPIIQYLAGTSHWGIFAACFCTVTRDDRRKKVQFCVYQHTAR